MNNQVRRMIEVDMPIRIISENAQHEQNIRKGHLHSMHIWWATRPLVACRAVILGALLPDPTDEQCPEEFRRNACEALDRIKSGELSNPVALRRALLDFIGIFSAWEASTDPVLLKTARRLIKAAWPEGTPIVVDPFAGSGSIPLEALRIGADTFASDLNPVSSLLLKTVLEDIPRFGEKLTKALRQWGIRIVESAKRELQPFYPSEGNDGIPYAYLWARRIRCEGPGCGVEVPLIGLLWLSKKGKRKSAIRYWGEKKKKRVMIEIFEPSSEKQVQRGIVNRFTATCPVCGYTTPYDRVVRQLQGQSGGTRDAIMLAVVTIKSDGQRGYRLATETDLEVSMRAAHALQKLMVENQGSLPLIPDEPLPPQGTLGFRIQKYGMRSWGDLFNPRQALALSTFTKSVTAVHAEILRETCEPDFARAVTTCLSLAVSNMAHYLSSLSIWASDGMISAFVQGSSLPMRPDFAEANPLISHLVGGFNYSLDKVIKLIEREETQGLSAGTTHAGPAQDIPLPDQSVPIVVTDPPYYDAVPYAALSDFCYVWLRRMLRELYPNLFRWRVTSKEDECILDTGSLENGKSAKDRTFFEDCIRKALSECKRVISANGISVILFAHKGTAGWEAMLNALVTAGWTVTASWPIATERGARMRAYNSAVLESSVFLVCRPRGTDAGVGDWREVLSELQPRVHAWMQRLVNAGIVGADAIFACIGPALELYSRYDAVETAGGKRIVLADEYGRKGELIQKGYLSYLWESVAKEALNMIFEGADPTGFEQDSRLTAMWLWTLRTGTNGTNRSRSEARIEKKANGYTLEYDAVRKIAQGLGAHLEELSRPGGIVEIKGNVATLFFVKGMRETLFGKRESDSHKMSRGQTTLFGEPLTIVKVLRGTPETGETTLDRLHQAMLLFGDGKSEALKRFLVDEGVGKDDRFWRLAQALSALYPQNSEEKRWVDGVLGRRKSLGF